MSFEFGALSSINPITATLAFILTIIFLLFFEFLTGALEYVIEGNQVYNQMLQKIYKELMCMGFVSFVLAIYRAENNAAHLDELFRVTEFIEYILFFQAIFYVAHSLYIMFISVVTSSYYEKLHARSVLDILEQFTKLEKTWSARILSAVSFLPLSRTIQEAEFKIIYALFRDTYWLPLDFDYGAYLSGCLANYALKLINVGVYSWIIMISLSLINLGRLKVFGNSAFNCHGYQFVDDVDHESTTDDHHTTTDDHGTSHRILSSSTTPERQVTHHCEHQHLYLFLLCGGILCVYITLLYMIAQIYMKRLLGRAGVLTLSDYSEFLMFEERANINTEKRKIEIHKDGIDSNHSDRPNPKKARRMTIRTFKSNITNLRAASGHDHQNEEFEVYRKISRALSVHFNVTDYFSQAWEWFTDTITSFYYAYFTPRVHDSSFNGSRAKLIFRDSSVRPHSKEIEVKSSDSIDVEKGNDNNNNSNNGKEDVESNQPQRGGGRRKRRVSTMLLLSGGPLATTHQMNPMELKSQDSMTAVERFKLHKFQQITDSDEKVEFLKHVRKNDNKTREEMKLTEDMSQIYLFNSPELFCRAIEVGIMLNSLYLALWATNFLYVVAHDFHNTFYLHLMLLVPVVYILPCIGEIVKASSLLSAIAELNLNVIGSVLEETEDRGHLVLELQTKINIRLEGVVATQKEVLSSLFDEIDTDGSGFINRAEFRNMMQALHLHYSDEKFKRLFKAVDKNKDGSISIDELYQILFPEKAEEEAIQKRSELVEKHIEERRQSHIHNTSVKPNKFTGPLSVLNGFGKSSDIPEAIPEDTESKNADGTDHSNTPSPKAQKITNSFDVGGRVVRLSKAATTGRISVPQQDFQVAFKKFEKPKMFAEEILHTNSTDTRKPIEQVHQFTALHELDSPRNNTVTSPTESERSSNKHKESIIHVNSNVNSNLSGGGGSSSKLYNSSSNISAYHAINEEDENHSDLDNVEDISSSQRLFSPRTRGRSKSDDGQQSRKNSSAIPITRNSFIGENTLENKHKNKEFDTVSGFDDNINNDDNNSLDKSNDKKNENNNNKNNFNSNNNNNGNVTNNGNGNGNDGKDNDNDDNNNDDDNINYNLNSNNNDNNDHVSTFPSHGSNVVVLPPINHPTTKNWNMADMEEESCV